MRKQLNTIAEWLNSPISSQKDAYVTGVSIDSRNIKDGDLFIPFIGENTNGHQYVQKAIENGAVGSLWQKGEPNPPENLPLIFVEDSELALQQMARKYREELNAQFIGITGSNGKTSTKDLVAGVLSPYFKVQKTEGNFNNQLGLPLTILSLHESTEFAVLEMGMSNFGEIEFLSTLARPHYAVITNIGEAHMQDLGSREGIAQAKFEIVKGLDSNGKLFYDGDEPLLTPFTNTLPSKQKISFGHAADNDLYIEDIISTEKGSEFSVKGILNETFTIPVLGTHQVKNALSAILIGLEAGLSAEQVRQSLLTVSLTNMRMQLMNGNNGALFINDAYNAAPTSMKAALKFMAQTDLRPEKWVVLGDMLELGDDEQQYHEQLVEEISTDRFTGVCLYGPRMKWLYESLKDTFTEDQLIWTEDNYESIINVLSSHLNSKSIVLFKGSRGMALENILKAFV